MSSRRENYLNYLVYGGDMRDLPAAVSREDEYWLKLCQMGFGLPQHTAPFIKATLNSESAGANFCSAIFDLGETKRVTGATVKARFTVRQGNGATGVPTAINFKLFANNSKGRDVITDYTLNKMNAVTTIEFNKEYNLEYSYDATSGDKNLQDFRYLKPFIQFMKTDQNDADFTETHRVDIHEISIVVDNTIYNITDTVRDYAPKEGSDFQFIKSAISEGAIQSRRSPWYGLKVNCLGDSITFGLHPNPSVDNKQSGQAVASPWAMQLKDLCGFAHVRNYGVSGDTVATSNGKESMVARYINMSNDADIIIFKGGVNDHSLNIPIGELIATNKEKTTYFGALNFLFEELKKKYPNKPIIAMTPMDYSSVDSGINGNTNGDTIEDYRNALKMAAGLHGVIVFNLHEEVSFNAHNAEDVTNFIPDKLHPNQAGHDNMAEVISLFLNTKVRPY